MPAKKDNQDAQQRARVAARLTEIARQLRHGEGFPITRLTVLKQVCSQPRTAAAFGLYLMKRARSRAARAYRPAIDRAIREMERYLRKPSHPPAQSLWSALRELQNEYKRIHWGVARIIRSREALVAENALCCAAYPTQCALWAYQAAKDLAEHYDPRFPYGLVPASVPAVSAMAKFRAAEVP